ncbi:MAG: GAF domain-containing protein [Anaerolineales bacterium]|nr:GAF domain-containing protein [Anaerolineales bacterium]
MDAKTMLLASFNNPRSRRTPSRVDLTRSLNRIRALVEHIAEAVLIVQADSGQVLVANQSALLLFEAEQDTLTGRDFSQLSGARGRGATKQYQEHLSQLRNGASAEFAWEGKTPNGKPISGTVEMSPLPIKDADLVKITITHPETAPTSLLTEAAEGQHIDELAALALTGASIASSLDIDKVIQVVGHQLATLLDVNTFVAYDWLADTRDLRLRHSYERGATSKQQATPIAPHLDVNPVLEHGQPLQKQLGDAQLLPSEEQAMKAAGASTVLLLPLIAQSKTIGLVELQDKTAQRDFTSREIYLVQTLCHQAAVAIENARLFQATRRQLQELTILQQVANATTEAHTEDELIESATQLIRHSIYSDNFGIILLTESGNELRIHPSYESAPEIANMPIALGQGVTGRVAQTGKPIRLDDTRQHLGYLDFDKQTLSELCVPMKIGERVIGVINTESRELNHFTEDDERLLTTLAGQLATGIERLRNAAAETRRTHQLAVLNELTNRMSGVLERDKLFQIIVECLHRRMGYDSTDISRVDDETQSYIIEAVAGEFTEHASRQGYSQPFGVGLLDLAARTGELVVANDAQAHPDFFAIEGFPEIHSELIIPIKIYKRVYALLNIESHKHNAFDDYEVASFSTLGDQISLSLESIHLFESTKRQLQELTMLHAITQAAVNAKNEDELVERATEIIGASMYTDKFGFLLMHPDRDRLVVHPSYRGISSEAPTSVALSQGITGTVASTGAAIRVPDVHKEPSYMRINPLMRSELCVPILGSNNEVLGVINAESTRINAFSDADMRLLNTIAGQTGTALAKLRLFEAERIQRSQAETLREVAAILGSAADRASVLDLILEQLKRVVPFDSASVQLVKGDRLIIHAVAGKLPPSQVGLELPIQDDKFAHPLLFEQRTVLYEDISQHPDWLQIPGAEQIKSWIGAPLIARGNCIGVLTIDGYTANQFSQADADLVASFAIHAGIALENVRLFEEAQDAYLQTVSALASAIDVRDTYTSGHSQRLVDLAVETGRLLGCTADELTDIKWGALLHDIGKIGVPDEILRKPSSLEQAELEVMRQHPEIGARIVEPVRNLASVAPIIRAHQERYDGSGYPDGLKGEQIPKIARIISVADAYVAMTDERVYREARTKEEAIAELKRCSGSQFDPNVVNAFLQVVDTCPEE